MEQPLSFFIQQISKLDVYFRFSELFWRTQIGEDGKGYRFSVSRFRRGAKERMYPI